MPYPTRPGYYWYLDNLDNDYYFFAVASVTTFSDGSLHYKMAWSDKYRSILSTSPNRWCDEAAWPSDDVKQQMIDALEAE